ncbi:hypothetical protein D3C87_768890 [compost metagenome]
MKKILLFCFSVFLLTLSNAQNSRFFYEYNFKLDSLHRDSIKTEMMVLEISPKGSHFVSHKKVVYDSTLTASFKNSQNTGQTHFDFTHLRPAVVNFQVTKNYPDYKTSVYLPISSELFKLEYSKALPWKILQEKSTIEGIKVQKATVDAMGRSWIAWFAEEIQIQDGPYRFSGLPGLILKLEDSNGDHIFVFKGNRKLKEESSLTNSNLFRHSIAVTDDKFNQQWQAYKKDPAKNLRAKGGSGSTVVVSASFDGKSLNSNDIMKQIEKEAKEEIAKNNNPIDLSLYK